MLFDERKNPFHLMLRDLINCGGLDSFFKAFKLTVTDSNLDKISGEEHNETYGTISEFLDSWLLLLEKMVNPKMVLESPHSMALKSQNAIGYVPFDPIQYLVTIHRRAFEAIESLWALRTKKFFSDQASGHILTILCHILKGETIINDHMKKEKDKESETATGPANLSNNATTVASLNQRQTARRTDYSQAVNPDHLQQLMDMGFPREAVVDALMQSQTIEQATDYLLLGPQSSSNWSGNNLQDPALPPPVAAPVIATDNQDVDMVAAEENQTDPKPPTKIPVVVEPQRDEPLPKPRVDSFTDNLLPGSLHLMDEIPSTVFKICDLIQAVSQRNGDAWCSNLLRRLLEDIIDNVKLLLSMSEPLRAKDKKSFQEWTSQLINSPEANKVAVRVHLYSLLFDEMKIQCANYLHQYNAIDCLISLLEVGLDLFSLSRDSSYNPLDIDFDQLQQQATPKWLAPTILLVDLYEKGSVASYRRAPLLNNQQRTWQWFEERSGRWTPYTPANNKIIDTAYKNGEQYARYSVGRKHYLAQFSSMLQINEDTNNLRPIMMTLSPVPDTEMTTDERELVPIVPHLRDHQSKTLIQVCVGFMHLPIDPNSLQAVMRLSFRLTRSYNLAVMFAEMGGIRALQNLPESSQFNGFVSLATLIMRHVIEEPQVLYQTMEKLIRSTTQHCQHNQKEMHFLLRALGSAACRDEENFKRLAVDIMRITRPPSTRRDDDETKSRPDGPQLIKVLPPKSTSEPIKPSPVTRCLIADLLDSLTIPIQTKTSCELNNIKFTANSSECASVDSRLQQNDIGNQPGMSSRSSTSNPALPMPMDEQPKHNEPDAPIKHHNPLLNHSIVLRVLAELTRSYSVVPKIIAEHIFTPATNEAINEDTSALAFILDNILPTTQTHSDKDGPALARVFIAALASCNHCVDAQIAVVTEVKASLNRAAYLPESCEKHARLQSLATIISTMIDCCPSVPSQQSTSRQNQSIAYQQRLSNNIVRLFVRKGLVTDLARIPHSLDLSAPHMFATMNSILKPLETLSRFVNVPSQPGQSRHHAPPAKKACSSSSSSSDMHDGSATPIITTESTTAPGDQSATDGTVHSVQVPRTQSSADENLNDQEFDTTERVTVRTIGSNDMNAESRDNVVNSNGAESESGDDSRSEEDDDEEDEDNGEVSGVDEREGDADDEDDDDEEEEDDDDEDHVDDDDDHVDEEEADDEEALNAFGDNQFGDEYRIYNGSLHNVLNDLEEHYLNQTAIHSYPDRASNLMPGVYESSMDETSAPSLPPPPGGVGLTHPLLLRRMDHVPNSSSIQTASGPSALGSRTHRYARPRLLRGGPGGGINQWHAATLRHPPQTILQQLLGPNTVQEVLNLTNQIGGGPGRLFVADFQQWLTTEDDTYQEPTDPHAATSSQATVLSNIPSVMSRWSEESRILDGGTLHDCLANIKMDIIPVLERFEEKETIERQEKRKKAQEEDDHSHPKKAKEPTTVTAQPAVSSEVQPRVTTEVSPEIPLADTPLVPADLQLIPAVEGQSDMQLVADPEPSAIPEMAAVPVITSEIQLVLDPQDQSEMQLAAAPETGLSDMQPISAPQDLSDVQPTVSESQIAPEAQLAVPQQIDSAQLQPQAPPTNDAPASSEGTIPDGVDPSFLAALPEDIRQEVLAEQWRLRRIERANTNRQANNATTNPVNEQASTSSGANFPEVNPEFLAALPAEVQEEVLAQQRAEQQRQAAINSNPDQPVDPAIFIQTLAPNLRRQVLADMDDSLLQLLPSDLLAEATALRRELMSNNATANSTLSRLLRTAAAGRMQRARYTITSVPDHLHTQPPWGWPLDRVTNSSLPHDMSAGRNLIALNRDCKFKGRQLLDPDALTCLVILLFVDEPRLNIARLHRVIRNLSYHNPTRQWVVHTMLSIIDRSKPGEDLGKKAIKNEHQSSDSLNINHNSSWMSISMDAALGCRASVFSIQRSTAGLSATAIKSISIHNQAAPSVCRHILEALIALAKSFPQHFFPEGLLTSADGSNDSESLANFGPEFWDILSKLDSLMSSTMSKKSRGSNKQLASGTSPAAIQPSPQLDLSGGQPTSPMSKIMGFLAHPIIKRSFTLTDRLLHLLAIISTAFPTPHDNYNETWQAQSTSTRPAQYARRSGLPAHNLAYHGRPVHSHRRSHFSPSLISAVNNQSQQLQLAIEAHNNSMSNTTSKALKKPETTNITEVKPTQPLVAKQYLKLAVDVLTSKSCSEDGLDDVTSLLSRLSRACPLTKSIVLELLMSGARQLGQTVCQHISTLKEELKNYNQKLCTKVVTAQPSTSSEGISPSSRGMVHDRFTSESVIIIAPSSSKGGREVQLPSMASLTSKNSSQAFFLRILKVITQLREMHVSNPNVVPTPLINNASRQQQPSTSNSSALQPASPQQTTAAPVTDAARSVAGQSAMDVDPSQPSEPITIKTDEVPAIVSPPAKPEESLSIELQLDDLWETLSQCLLELAETPDHHAVLVLQPAVEAFFLVHSPGLSQRRCRNHDDNSVDKNNQTSHIDQEVAPISPNDSHQVSDQPGGASGTLCYDTQKFLDFAETHRVVLNHILRQSTTPLSQGPFAVLVDHTRVLDFDVKRRYFRQELERLDEGIRRDDLGIHVRRDNVFEESFRELHRRMAEEWKNRFFVVFEDEEGQDAGGLLREWYTIISREIFNPDYALFTTSPGDRVTFMINSSSHCNTNHLTYFKFVGRVIAKAIYDNKLLDCYFTRSFYKHILGKPVKYTDMESEDYSFYQGLVFLLEHDVKELGYELTFSVEVREFDLTEVRELKQNGSNIPVTEENKHEYVRLVCQEKMTGSIRKQLSAFLEGFYDIIPKRLISIFNEQELELLISGLPNIDIDDLKASTEYHKYLPNSLQIQWFWRALRSFDQADRAKLLQFVTGTSKVPLQGFASLEGMNGVQKFQIHRDDRSTDRLPSAHTCFNQLDLPVYETYDKLRYMLLKAIQECSEGFGLA